MRKRSERSLVLFAVIFVFACLLFSGGSRLIGHEVQDDLVQSAELSSVRAAFSAVPAPRAELGAEPVFEAIAQRTDRAEAPKSAAPRARIICDANGNVLKSRSYLHTVYQAFSLGDGFV